MPAPPAERRSGDEVVGRLAPSPTGAQHLGNARTYLIAWLSARTQGGKLLLRIEDIDSPRTRVGATEQALLDLRWLGLTWDGEPIVQTSRLPLYQQALERLKVQELVYPCTCTRSDVEQAASAPHLEHEGPVYPATCSGRLVADSLVLEQEGRTFCWRFRVPERSPVFVDGFLGPCEVNLRQVGGDFVVWKTTGTPAYQLSVVVDDFDMGVTEVVRGDDLVPSTPRQILLAEALGVVSPKFVHVTLVVGPDGRRLAKRHGDTRIAALRESGVQPEMLLGLLAWSCGWVDRVRAVSLPELLGVFRLESIPRQPFVLREEHLRELQARAEDDNRSDVIQG
jgi:glutamyl-tRNA synthetase